MAMKPAGRAIVAGLFVVVGLAALHFGGVFDKLKKKGEEIQAVQPAPEPPPSPVVERPAPAPEPAPVVAAPQSSNKGDAFDQLIRQSGTK